MFGNVIAQTADGFPLFNSMEDVQTYSWGDKEEFAQRTKGYNTIGITTPGAMNAIYGPGIMNLAYNLANTLAVIGRKPYKTARRVQENLSKRPYQTSGIVRGGHARTPVMPNLDMIEQPYKLVTHRFNMTLGAIEIGNKNIDDIATWNDLFLLEGQTFMFSQNGDLLRRIEDPQEVGLGSAVNDGVDPNSNEFVGFESLDRIISNAKEGDYLPEGYNVPWRMNPQMPSTDSGAPMAKYRNSQAVNFKGYDNNAQSYVDANYDENTTTGEAELRVLDLGMIDAMFANCIYYWQMAESSRKVMTTGTDTLQKMQTILQPQQRYLGYVGSEVDVNGIKTLPGRDTGLMVSTYQGVPMIFDMYQPKGYGATEDGHTTDGVSSIYLMDTDNIFFGALREIQVDATDSPLITNRYVRLADMNLMGEVQATSFRGSGKIKHIK